VYFGEFVIESDGSTQTLAFYSGTLLCVSVVYAVVVCASVRTNKVKAVNPKAKAIDKHPSIFVHVSV